VVEIARKQQQAALEEAAKRKGEETELAKCPSSEHLAPTGA
jgi:hypothetical protein